MIRTSRAFMTAAVLCAAAHVASAQSRPQPAPPVAARERISIATKNTALHLFVAADDGRLYQLRFGPAGKAPALPTRLNRQDEFYPASGDAFISEPALQATHADGNTSTNLVYLKHDTSELSPGVSLTRIDLKDAFYPFHVSLFFKAYQDSDILEQWSEIRHDEDGPVMLHRFMSAAPVFRAKTYHLTQFQGEYRHEATLIDETLSPGIKVLDSKIGVRAHRYRTPSFLVALDGPAQEESGSVVGASLEWPGSFQLAFEIDWQNRLRAHAGINPFAAAYHLDKGKAFTTPPVLWSFSDHGKGQVSRNFHRWARTCGIRDGYALRPILLNNWEATRFDFDEQKIVALFDGAWELGVDLFLLDDGWFGNKHPRDNDKAGLGDWDVNHHKLPHGLGYLADEARKRGLAFGIWIEPEMVNPASELFEQHPDWAIQQPHRPLEFYRNQLVLDLTRPEARQHAWHAIQQTLATPGVSYVKWDANRHVTQPGSTYLPPEKQSNLLTDYNFALLGLMKQMAEQFPTVTAMACSGGGGRVDYGTMKNFHSFWPSDNTDPVGRVKIQWGFGHFFPASTLCAHVTRMGNRNPKFACDVALSGAFGIDRDLSRTPPDEHFMLAQSVKLYKASLRAIVQQGDLYRLDSPYQGPRAAFNYVLPDQSKAALFVYQLQSAEARPVQPHGLDPKKHYRVREVNLPQGKASQLPQNDTVIDGASLMRDGLTPPCHSEFDSAVIELTAESP